MTTKTQGTRVVISDNHGRRRYLLLDEHDQMIGWGYDRERVEQAARTFGG